MRSPGSNVFFLLALLAALSACGPERSPARAVLFEGARLIRGDGSAPIQNSSFIVQNGRIAAVGRSGDVSVPPYALRVDLSGKTVMPALIDLYVHVGFLDVAAMTDAASNYSLPNIREHQRRLAYYGVGTALSLGLDAGDEAFGARAPQSLWEARLLTAGRAIAAPAGGPGPPDRRDRAYGITTAEEARDAVRDLADRGVALITVWVDDRGGTVEKPRPDLARAVIDEAHRRGLRVLAHVFALADAKDLLRAGVDGFAQGVGDAEVDQELLALLSERPDFFLVTSLSSRGPTTVEYLPFVGETVPAAEVERMRAELADPPIPPVSGERFRIEAHNLTRLVEAGVLVGMGTASGGGGWNAHEEMADMVAAGMSPAEVITAATGSAAAILGLDDVGTIVVGNSADFLVLHADPMTDIANTRRLSDVYVRGEAVPRRRLQARWTWDNFAHERLRSGRFTLSSFLGAHQVKGG